MEAPFEQFSAHLTFRHFGLVPARRNRDIGSPNPPPRPGQPKHSFDNSDRAGRQTGSVRVTKIECESCETKFEGDFEIPRLLKLPAEDLKFVEEFLLTSGSLKEMAKRLDISYPTVRNKLNSVIEEIERLASTSKSERDKVLSALEKGTITAKEAAKKLREI